MSALASQLSLIQQGNLTAGTSAYDNGQTINAQSIINSQVEASDVAHFSEIMNGTTPVGAMDEAVQVQFTKFRDSVRALRASQESGELTFGDKVFNGVSHVREKLDSNLSNIQTEIIEHLNVKDLDPAQLVDLQFKVSMFSFELEMANGIVHKSGQHVDTFLKSQ